MAFAGKGCPQGICPYLFRHTGRICGIRCSADFIFIDNSLCPIGGRLRSGRRLCTVIQIRYRHTSGPGFRLRLCFFFCGRKCHGNCIRHFLCKNIGNGNFCRTVSFGGYTSVSTRRCRIPRWEAIAVCCRKGRCNLIPEKEFSCRERRTAAPVYGIFQLSSHVNRPTRQFCQGTGSRGAKHIGMIVVINFYSASRSNGNLSIFINTENS